MTHARIDAMTVSPWMRCCRCGEMIMPCAHFKLQGHGGHHDTAVVHTDMSCETLIRAAEEHSLEPPIWTGMMRICVGTLLHSRMHTQHHSTCVWSHLPFPQHHLLFSPVFSVCAGSQPSSHCQQSFQRQFLLPVLFLSSFCVLLSPEILNEEENGDSFELMTTEK